MIQHTIWLDNNHAIQEEVAGKLEVEQWMVAGFMVTDLKINI
ncbi:MAG TPA: hypothetical protein VFD91_02905 [Mariniphaga sp.]|nr:hypothetical protein [Mariniphaga sp.]